MATKTVTDRENMINAARMTHDNQIIRVGEVLNETNDVIQDAIVQQANDITSHVISRRTRLPGSQWVKIGNGWQATVGLANQVREEIGMQKARFQAPRDMMRMQANPDQYRQNQERAYIESMGQEVANTLFGNYASGALSPVTEPPEEFAGFQRRYSSLGTADSAYVINNGNGSGNDNTSAWFVRWSPTEVYLIHPRNTGAGGLKREDMGLQLVPGDNAAGTVSTNNNMLWAFVTEFSWDVGLAIEDTRSVKRLANIDSVSTETNTLDIDKVIQIRNNFKKGPGTVFMYVNETVFTQLDILANDKTNVLWNREMPFGQPQLMFRDMPVRREDAISNVEGVLT